MRNELMTMTLIAAAASATLLSAAEPATQLRGRVTDSAGAAIAGATVTVRQSDGLAHRRVTDDKGFYGFDGLARATYSVRIAKPGFRTWELTGVAVNGVTVLDRRLAISGAPVRAIFADATAAPPDIRPLLADAQSKWAHVRLAPEIDYAAPRESMLRSRILAPGLAEIAQTALRESPQLAPVFAPGNPENRPAFRIRFNF